MDKPHIGVLCYYTFPEGMAPTTRIIAYSKGLCANGADVDIYSFAFLEKNQKKVIDGKIGEVKFHMSPVNHTSNHITNAFKRFIWIRIKTIIDIYKANRKSKFQCILVSFDNLPYMFSFVPILKLLGLKLVFIGDEFPPPIRALKKKVPKLQILAYKFLYKFIGKRILMTKNLEVFYNTEISFKPTFLLNSIIDTDRFEKLRPQKTDREYLCYMGNMMLAKDDVCTIVRAFSLIAEKYPELDLYLFGSPGHNDFTVVSSLIDELGLKDRAFVKGRASYKEVPQILINAKVLLTAQPKTVRAQGGFPTKLGEYMMSKRPIILTDVGEISKYVENRVHVMIVPPSKPDLYAISLESVLNDEALVKNITENAYNLAYYQYGSVQVTKDMLQFIAD